MRHLFAYGTLMSADILQEVTHCRRSGTRGCLQGYRCRTVSGEDYPGIEPCRGARVVGVVYRDLPSAAWRRLDRFEGSMYRRRSVSVRLEGGGHLRAQAYVVKPGFRRHLAPRDWDFGDFLRNRKARFRRGYRGCR